jgi:antirestriction protein ArdC
MAYRFGDKGNAPCLNGEMKMAARNLQKEVTARILEALRKGVVPWRKPWSGQGSMTMPRNAVTHRAYSGVNVILLWMTAEERSYPTQDWLTFKQALDAGGNVRKGEKGTTVIFVSSIEREEDGKIRRIPFLKAFTVFNVAQCDGLSLGSSFPLVTVNADQRHEIADAFMAATGAEIVHGGGRAFWSSATDVITLPPFETFTAAGKYYATAFHELGHWTGAKNRLARDMGKRFDKAAYSAEELVAELTSAFLCAEFGFETEDQDAAYIAHYIQFLSEHDNAIVAAASHASRAVDFMRNLALAEPLEIAA